MNANVTLYELDDVRRALKDDVTGRLLDVLYHTSYPISDEQRRHLLIAQAVSEQVAHCLTRLVEGTEGRDADEVAV